MLQQNRKVFDRATIARETMMKKCKEEGKHEIDQTRLVHHIGIFTTNKGRKVFDTGEARKTD